MKKALLFLGVLIMSLSCTKQTNPFFLEYDTPFGVPPFESITPGHIAEAFDEAMKQEKEEINLIAGSTEEPTFENTIAAYANSGQLMAKVNAVFSAQSAANTNEALQTLETEITPLLTSHGDEISLNSKLFARIKKVYDKKDDMNLTEEQLFILENMYKGFVRNGANLTPEEKEKLKAVNQKLASLNVEYVQNVLAETNGFQLIIGDEKDLAGLPEGVIQGAAETAKASGLDGKWVFTPHRPSLYPFLTYADNRELRKKLYDSYILRGDNGNEYDNNKLLSEINKLRVEQSNILGYPSHAHLKLESKMAKTPENVYALLNRLWQPALEVAKKERDEMQEIIDREGGNFKLEAHDWWYYAEKLRKEKYNLDDNELRPYFSLNNVRDGAYMVATNLYGITFEEIINIPLPHPDAQAFEVKNADGTHLGVLYWDFHPRASKSGGAWCGTYRDQSRLNGELVSSVVTIVCNFTNASGNAPALISTDEVETLFHEFGHALDNLLSNKTYASSYRSTDFAELPSQIMEHWGAHPAVLKEYAKHYETGETIPDELIKKIENSGYFNQGFTTVEYLAACFLDMAYSSQTEVKDTDIRRFEKEYFEEIGLIPEIITRYRSTYFNHITQWGYSAGYYSYIWSGVLDADAFEAFKETSLYDKETADRFRRTVLARIGIADPMKLYVEFRGREPKIEPLLKKRGLL
ncbi:MAG: M3 family metallopeptidase [Bacteroidetes bacterium]|nr:M3 family metallopeptidase [Bacteroidota bacterium]